MPDIVMLMLPIFLLVGLGAVSVKIGLLSPTHIEGLAAFVINVALPAVLLSALSRQDLAHSFNAGYLLAYGAGSLVAFLVVLAVLRTVLKRPLDKAAMGGLGASASNSGFIGFPVASLAFGETALVALPLVMLVENVLILPLAFVLVEWGASGRSSALAVLRQTAARLARMPLVLAIVAGVILALLGVRLPAPVVTSLDMLTAASAATALFVVGGTIATLRAGDLSADIAPIVIGKLLIHPLAVAAFLFAVPGVPGDLMAVGILLAGVSMATIYPILSRRTGTEEMASAALIVATTIALVTLPVLLLLVAPLTQG